MIAPNRKLRPAKPTRPHGGEVRYPSTHMRTTSEAGLPPVPGGEILLSKQQLAQHLGVSERTIDNWRKQFGLPCLKVNHTVLFRLIDVMQHLEKHNGRTAATFPRIAPPSPII